MPGILYALVARATTVLAEATQEGLEGNFANVTRVLLKKIPAQEDSKMSYAYDEYVFHYTVQNGLTVLCMTEKETSRIAAFRFINAAEDEFLRNFATRWQTAQAYKFDRDFKGALARLMTAHSRPETKDNKMGQISGQLDEIKGVMQKNIELVLERGEKIEILVNKTEQLEEHAFRFQKKSTSLRRKFCCANVKWMILIAIVLMGLIYMILAFSCGGPALPKCHK